MPFHKQIPANGDKFHGINMNKGQGIHCFNHFEI